MIPDRETVILKTRFRKAQALATLLMDEGIDSSDIDHMTDTDWDIAVRAARLKSAGPLTRVLTGELIGDREERLTLLKSNGWKI